jgi:large subunit ribosomal protein L23
MALFGKKTKTDEVKEQKATPATKARAEERKSAAPASANVSVSGKHAGSVILSPRITEKAAFLSQHNAYAFNVTKNASKQEIMKAIQAIYKVTPVDVRVLPVLGKRVMTRSVGRVGRTASGKKAYVYLKKGETIDIA